MNVQKSPFTVIPGVGPSISNDLEKLGFRDVASLKGEDPGLMYARLMDLEQGHIDRCVLHAYAY